MRSIRRTQISFLIDVEDDQKLRETLPGLNLSAKLSVAVRNFLDDVKNGVVTTETVLNEEKRVKDRAFRRKEN